eukprot:11271871-Alexandrium_andersonii.AAC.1
MCIRDRAAYPQLLTLPRRANPACDEAFGGAPPAQVVSAAFSPDGTVQPSVALMATDTRKSAKS